MSGGKRVRLEITHAGLLEGRPSLFVLHGSSGATAGRQYAYRLLRAFAHAGYPGVMVSYFDRTDTRRVTYSHIIANAAAWRETVADAITHCVAEYGLSREGISTCGHSLGGFLAVSHAARDPRVRACIVFAGGIDPFTKRNVTRLPSMLLIHGEEDRQVAPEASAELAAICRKVGAACTIQLFPGEAHVLSPTAVDNAIRTAVPFVEKHSSAAALAGRFQWGKSLRQSTCTPEV